MTVSETESFASFVPHWPCVARVTLLSAFSDLSQACLDCICRGCQNSYMANGEKKLEAFAVPEKALEQTRLTLGINLTSITAAAALRNPATTSIRANTLLNVATATGTPVSTAFLSSSPPQEPNYEESLELLIGWEAGTPKIDSMVLIECDNSSLSVRKRVPTPLRGRKSKAAMGLSCPVICFPSVSENAE